MILLLNRRGLRWRGSSRGRIGGSCRCCREASMTGSTKTILFVSSMRSEALDMGRPGYHPSVHLKLYIYGYLYRVQSSRRLERECHRNLEVMWLLERLAPDPKPIPA